MIRAMDTTTIAPRGLTMTTPVGATGQPTAAPAALGPPTAAEREARVRLATCYRVFAHLGWTEAIFNHITLRVPAVALPGLDEAAFLINPFGLHYSEVTASNLVLVNLQGQPLRPSAYPVNRAGFTVHSAIHAHVESAHCVMHTHTTTGSAVACLEEGLSHDNFYGAQLHERVAYHDFEGITVNPDEQTRFLASMAGQRVVILRNHGLLTWGETVEEAFVWLWTLQRACDVQVASGQAGRVKRLLPSVRAATRREAAGDEPAVCQAVFDAWVRQIDKIDGSYRD
jgi:ribulose-5-phosphate 4-epimerase/fuculose-1-phosphate aldolase